MEIRVLYQHLVQQLLTVTDDREARSLARWLLTFHWPEQSGLLLPQSTATVPDHTRQEIETQLHRLLTHEPIQYVLGEAWFDGLRLWVQPGVLIPRPETEELVHWAVETCRQPRRVLDVGTGSGCIPLALQQHWPSTVFTGWDASAAALAVAEANSMALDVSVNWQLVDLLAVDEWPEMEPLDLLISNPPYIPRSESKRMHNRVVAFEPEMALFVPDDDPLVFYRLLLQLAQRYLHPDGWLMVEIHEGLAGEVRQLWSAMGATRITLKSDRQGKPRMMAAQCQKKLA